MNLNAHIELCFILYRYKIYGCDHYKVVKGGGQANILKYHLLLGGKREGGCDLGEEGGNGPIDQEKRVRWGVHGE